MQLDAAKVEGKTLLLFTADPKARTFVYGFKPGNYDIVKAAPKRSLDANAYCWELCTKISRAVGITKEDVYRRAIKDGNHYIAINLQPSDIAAFKRSWQTKGIGWVAEEVDDAEHGKLVFAYMGSSSFDRAQMNELIDALVQECKAMDIEVRPEEEVNSLLGAWDG